MAKEKATTGITRSSGLPAGVGPWVVGGGYSGATDELDKTVQKGAEMLRKAYGRDVEIRFNSDRRSGGAWLKDDKQGFAGNDQVGLSAMINAIPPKGMTRHQWHDAILKKYDDDPDKWKKFDKDLDAAPKGVIVQTYVAEVARDPKIYNSGNLGHRYSSIEHDSLDDGLDFLLKNVDPKKVNVYKGKRLAMPELPTEPKADVVTASEASQAGEELSEYGHQKKAKYKVTSRKSHTSRKVTATSTGLGSVR